jgi:hypothetical protein
MPFPAKSVKYNCVSPRQQSQKHTRKNRKRVNMSIVLFSTKVNQASEDIFSSLKEENPNLNVVIRNQFQRAKNTEPQIHRVPKEKTLIIKKTLFCSHSKERFFKIALFQKKKKKHTHTRITHRKQFSK